MVTECNARSISIQQQNAPNQLIKNTAFLLVADTGIRKKAKQYNYKIIKRLPHDEQAFTQGLVFLQDTLYESTGLLGQSEIHKLDSNTGEIKQIKKLAPYYFGEGISIFKNQLVQLTWGSEHVFVYDLKKLEQIDDYKFHGEGWGLTTVNKKLLSSDGSATLKWLNNKLGRLKDIHVSENGIAVAGLNELEYADGYVYANVWPGDCIAQINPANGNIDAWINLSELYHQKMRPHWTAILNGIAYRSETDTFFVTGKYWPYIYELAFLATNEHE